MRPILKQLFASCAALLGLVLPAAAGAQTCSRAPAAEVAPAVAEEIARLNAAMAAARIAGDADALIAHYTPDSLIMPEHQQRLFGPEQGRAYYRALFSRTRVGSYSAATVDVLPLDNGALEWGTFTLAYAPAGEERLREVDGKYMQLWRRQADGKLKLKAEVWGFLEPLGPSASHWLLDAPATVPRASASDLGIAAELDALNAANGEAVRSHSSSRIEHYAQDAVFLPYAQRPQVGLHAIRAHLLPYIEAGRGATFDSVRLWNEGIEVMTGYVIEYANFEVSWRAGDASGVTSGGGLRLWRREADCSLKMVREAGIHHRP